MPRQNKRRTKRVKNLMVICTLSALLLSISTYAWFIGMRTVNVSAFEVEIASTKSLLLSLDGENFEETVNISEAILDQVSYANHTNSWGGKGLIPMSSVGEMDTSASRMKLFEKASLTATPGGYRLLASRVNNFQGGNTEQDGYVVFDLFIKNYSGNQYITELNEFDEEAIYLTTDSTVEVANGGVSDTGIENSVRVAFAQIGRVNEQTATATDITGITCEPDTETGEPSVNGAVTGICRTAQIWEPNDTKHVDGAISWYNKSCRARKAGLDGEKVTEVDSYEGVGTCGEVKNLTAYPTYAVSDAIHSSDNVDIYDGEAYNSYTGSSSLLKDYQYFTDTDRDQKGTAREAFMYLAPNSVTKVRVYIYIEGQDVDNYDFAQIGKRISIKFGFTKERFTAEDIEYAGPGLDFEKPEITLEGDKEMTITQGEVFTDPGATANDNKDGDLTSSIVVDSSKVDTETPGTYVVYYRVMDAAGNKQTAVRTVFVK